MLKRLLFLAFSLVVCNLPVQAGRLLDLEIVNRNTGQTLDVHRHRGANWVAGNPGDRYALRLVNRTGQRVLVVLSVDGVNVVSGETASPEQTGYVLDPWERTEIAGWRKSQQEVAQFYFTALPDSYAARTDRPGNVGVIGAAVFREKVIPPQPVAPAPYRESRAAESAAADSASAGAPRASPSQAPSAAPESSALAKATRQAERLGTGHGEREYSPISYTGFERASSGPAEVVSVRYDSRANLLARGVVTEPRGEPRPVWPEPRPFPGSFVPDPRS